MTVLEIIEKTIMNEIICSTRIAKITATAIVEELEKEGFEVTEGGEGHVSKQNHDV